MCVIISSDGFAIRWRFEFILKHFGNMTPKGGKWPDTWDRRRGGRFVSACSSPSGQTFTLRSWHQMAVIWWRSRSVVAPPTKKQQQQERPMLSSALRVHVERSAAWASCDWQQRYRKDAQHDAVRRSRVSLIQPSLVKWPRIAVCVSSAA